MPPSTSLALKPHLHSLIFLLYLGRLPILTVAIYTGIDVNKFGHCISTMPKTANGNIRELKVLDPIKRCTTNTIVPQAGYSSSTSSRHASLFAYYSNMGIVAARLLEPDCWQRVTQERYAKVVAEPPGHGKLHHYLELPTHHLLILQ